MTETKRAPVTDPATGEPLARREQPGYYPGWVTLAQQAYWDKTTRELVLKRVTEVPPLRFFAPEQARTMQAVVDRVLPQDDRTEERRVPILPHIDERLYSNRIEGYRYADMPSDQEAYRIAAAAFEAMARELHGRRFDELTTMEQERILQSVHDGKPLAAEEAWRGVSLSRFWDLLVSDCATPYYAHPWVWDEIGFGGPAYPRGYMRLEEGQPEPWEVEESRYGWAAPADTLSGESSGQGSGEKHQTHQGQGGTH